MQDQLGVVHRLIKAIASLHINIVKEESSAINYLNHHQVDLVLDWRTSPLKEFRPTPVHVLSRYHDLQFRIPVTDYRYVLLLESILCHCGDVLLFDHIYGMPLPAINIVPFSDWDFVQTEHVRIEPSPVPAQQGDKDSTHNFRVQMRIPDIFIPMIRFATKNFEDQPLPYILSSETNSRTLRVFFPKKDSIPRIVHVGIIHSDMPGALSAITHALAASKFNILTGLLRKKTAVQSRYETVLEYTGPGDIPPPLDPADSQALDNRLRWVHRKLSACDQKDLVDLSRFEVKICMPEYPRRPSKLILPIEALKEDSATPNQEEGATRPLDLLTHCITNVRAQSDPLPPLEEAKFRLLKSVLERMNRSKPSVFVSYPATAAAHGALLRDLLQRDFEVTEYQTADFEVILQRVKEKIRECDFFIGIWHHEHIGGSEVTVSPWMPFEYGVALEAGKEAIVIHSDKLPDTIWKRINAAIGQPGYNDLTFISKTLPFVVEWCRVHWLPRTRPEEASRETAHLKTSR
jgi:predicted amino acid-binding ACT domain protein